MDEETLTQPPSVEVVIPDEVERDRTPAAPRITVLSSEHQLLEDELRVLHNAMSELEGEWRTVTHPEEKCKLALSQLKLLEARRKFMKYSYGGPPSVGRPSGRDSYYDD